MTKTDNPKKNMTPIVKITLVNYDPAKQDEYDRNFISPLINGLLQRMRSVKPQE